MTWFELDPSFKKYAVQPGDNQGEAIMLHARLDPGSSITVDTNTDWAIVLIGVGTIASAMLTALFSYYGQRQQTKAASEGLKNQVRGNAATLRNLWMEQLRGVAAEFVQCAAFIVNERISPDNAEKDWSAMREKRDRALLLAVKMKFYVGTTSSIAKSIVDKADGVLADLNRLHDGKATVSDCYRGLRELENLIVEQLEQAWRQAKGDLGFVDD